MGAIKNFLFGADREAKEKMKRRAREILDPGALPVVGERDWKWSLFRRPDSRKREK